MDFQPLPWLLVAPFFVLQLAWYVGVIVLLFKIWGKVKHLPTITVTNRDPDTPGL